METKVSVEEARRILGKKSDSLTDQELIIYLARLQQLVEWILDEYERKIFGRTIREFN